MEIIFSMFLCNLNGSSHIGGTSLVSQRMKVLCSGQCVQSSICLVCLDCPRMSAGLGQSCQGLRCSRLQICVPAHSYCFIDEINIDCFQEWEVSVMDCEVRDLP